MLTELQQDIFTEITQDCTINLSGIEQLTVDQTPDYIKNPVRLHDTSTALFAALALSIEALGRERGLPKQQLEIDRRHAGLKLNSVIFQYLLYFLYLTNFQLLVRFRGHKNDY